MSYTEFYCDPVNGNQMNGGSDAGAPSYTATNGGWNSGTGVFTPTSGDPSLSVTVGQYASVFLDGATTPTFVGRVTAVTTTTITVSVAIKIGTVPTTAGSGLSIRVGGAWKGPNGANGFPLTSLNSNTMNSLAPGSTSPVRVNYRNNASYLLTAGFSVANTQVGATHQGYSSAVGDGGLATFDGQGNAVTILTGNAILLTDLIFQNATAGVSAGTTSRLRRCVSHDMTGDGFIAASSVYHEQCEAYACNSSNTANQGGFNNNATSSFVSYYRCISHDNTGANSSGFINSNSGVCRYDHCIADSNGGDGIKSSGGSIIVHRSDLYANGQSGIRLSAAINHVIENCNFVKNANFGVSAASASSACVISVINCGFGTGTKVNGSGATDSSCTQSGSVTYPADVTPWVDPANGDFRINLAAAKGTGLGAFTQTAASYAGAIDYPDIGAAQHQEVAAAAGAIIGS
jgi:hypothetical protein